MTSTDSQPRILQGLLVRLAIGAQQYFVLQIPRLRAINRYRVPLHKISDIPHRHIIPLAGATILNNGDILGITYPQTVEHIVPFAEST